jgi:hypothetical protein
MTNTPNAPDIETPVGLGWSGRKLWEATVVDFELSVHETGLLLQACRTLDSLDVLQARLDSDGTMVESPQGLRAHPALPELRQQRIALARLLAALGLPTGVEDDQAPKRQRRSVRGVYGIQS